MNVVSFGGGTNSTAMIIGMYLHKIPIDLILFADTGGEQPHTYEFMGTFNKAWHPKDRLRGVPRQGREPIDAGAGMHQHGMTACELCALDWLREEAEE